MRLKEPSHQGSQWVNAHFLADALHMRTNGTGGNAENRRRPSLAVTDQDTLQDLRLALRDCQPWAHACPGACAEVTRAIARSPRFGRRAAILLHDSDPLHVSQTDQPRAKSDESGGFAQKTHAKSGAVSPCRAGTESTVLRGGNLHEPGMFGAGGPYPYLLVYGNGSATSL
jgi:hypothetical protein